MLTNDEKQIIISGILGDGFIGKNGKNYYFSTNSKYKSYIDYKATYLTNLLRDKWYSKGISGYGDSIIHVLTTKNSADITALSSLTLPKLLNELDDFGVALWFYDDGSLHKSKYFYNLNTQNFSYEGNKIIKDYLENYLDVKCHIRPDKSYYYISINKLEGAANINNLLLKYPVSCYDYKTTDPKSFNEVRNLGSGKAIIVDNKYYLCIKDAALDVGVNTSSLQRAVRLNKHEYNGHIIKKV